MRVLLALALLALGGPAVAQQPALEPRPTEPPFEVRYAAWAAESILGSGHEGIGLEAFADDVVTGVYLRGRFGGQMESVGYGREATGRRYLWFSIDRGYNLDYVALLYDVDEDLLPDYLLFRTIDHKGRREYATEYRSPSVRGQRFDIEFQPACVLPACDPTGWTVLPRESIEVDASWFSLWRPLFGLAALRGENWLGRPVAELQAMAPTPPPP